MTEESLDDRPPCTVTDCDCDGFVSDNRWNHVSTDCRTCGHGYEKHTRGASNEDE